MMVGYMRVSTTDDRQSVDLQRDALLAAGVDERHMHRDRASGARDDRPGLKACLEYLKDGDVLVVWKLDRLGRSLVHLLSIITDLRTRGVAFRSLTEQMDTTTPHGELLFSIFGALAQYERALIKERVTAGARRRPAPRPQGWTPTHPRRRTARTDQVRPRRRRQQSLRVPEFQSRQINPYRHTGTNGVDGTEHRKRHPMKGR